jgi:hypothetical protein
MSSLFVELQGPSPFDSKKRRNEKRSIERERERKGERERAEKKVRSRYR